MVGYALPTSLSRDAADERVSAVTLFSAASNEAFGQSSLFYIVFAICHLYVYAYFSVVRSACWWTCTRLVTTRYSDMPSNASHCRAANEDRSIS